VTNNNAEVLASKYQRIITMYSLKVIDFDVEGAAIANTAANDLRARAILILKRNNPGLIIMYTLPALTTGLDHYGYALLVSAKQQGLNIDIINIMVTNL
jgi:hypothetical protein